MELLTRNEKMMKMKDLRTFNFGIPALKSRAGFVTCPSAGLCALGCYARQGWYTHRDVVVEAHEARLALTQELKFETEMKKAITKKGAERVRVHDSGDFYSAEYLQVWLSIMKYHRNVKFYAYTKRVEMLKSYARHEQLPKNFTVIYSYGGKEDHLIEPWHDRHCRVFENLKDLKAAGYKDASSDDTVALRYLKVGIVYHGQRSYENTNWGQVK